MSLDSEIASIVLAGGKGTRLFPLTLHHAKPAVPFGGKYRLIDIPISNSINSSIRTIFVIGQFLTAELQHHIHQTYEFGPLLDARIDFLTPYENAQGERIWFKGTADAVRQNLPHLLKGPAEYFLILSGDQLYNIDFQKMFAFAKNMDADLTVASLPILPSAAKRLGILEIDPQKRIIGFCEKPSSDSLVKALEMPTSLYKQLGLQQASEPHCLASMGIYIFKKTALMRLLEEDPREDFGQHLIPTAIEQGRSFAYIHRGYWEDIGTIQSFYDANMALVEGKAGIDTGNEQAPIFAAPNYLPGPIIKNTKITSSLISDGCLIEAKEVSHSIIGPGVHIGKGSVIKHSIVMGSTPANYCINSTQDHFEKQGSWIGKDCYLEKVILDENVQIHNQVNLHNKTGLLQIDREHFYIREGIIVVPKEQMIHPDTSL
ncbi:MAG: sugar phosphate nucleotidyltransferase [Chlamydiota bacterium]